MNIDEEYRLIRLAKENDRDAQEALLNQFNNLLCGISSRYSGRVGFKEMYQVAALNFLECIRLFDTERDPPLRLMTYAHKCVHRRCADYRRRGSLVVTIPKYTAPSLFREVKAALSAFSYNQETTSNPDGFVTEIVYRDEEAVEEIVSRKIEIADLKKKIKKLSEKERYVIRRRMNGDFFGEIGGSFGATKQRADQIDKRARRKLREMYEAENREITIA